MRSLKNIVKNKRESKMIREFEKLKEIIGDKKIFKAIAKKEEEIKEIWYEKIGENHTWFIEFQGDVGKIRKKAFEWARKGEKEGVVIRYYFSSTSSGILVQYPTSNEKIRETWTKLGEFLEKIGIEKITSILKPFENEEVYAWEMTGTIKSLMGYYEIRHYIILPIENRKIVDVAEVERGKRQIEEGIYIGKYGKEGKGIYIEIWRY